MKKAHLLCLIAVIFYSGLVGSPHKTSCAESDIYPQFIRLRFDRRPEGSSLESYLWERRVLSDSYRDSSWAEELTPAHPVWLPLAELPRKVKVGVALGGGGLRGAAHIGVLRALEENNIPIHGIVGTSMGAIVGGFYACGYSVDTLEYIMMNDIDWQAIFRDQPPRQSLPIWTKLREKPREPGIDLNTSGRWWGPFSYVPEIGIRVAQNFTDEIAKRTLLADYRSGFDFDSLPVPFGAMLTNMNTKKSELMTKGTIATATRASGSAPIYLEPMRIGNVPYVDGAVLDDLPVDAFIPFDSCRAPDKLLHIAERGEALYVIAVYPLKRRGERGIVEEPSLAGPFGLGVMGQTRGMARDFHLWNSWEAAQGKIDIDVQGFFDFSTEKLIEIIRAGYDAAWKEAGQIKSEIAALEDSIRRSGHRTAVCRVSAMRFYYVTGTDTSSVLHGSERDRILSAVRLKEGSHVVKTDLCDALKRVHRLGDFQNAMVRIDRSGQDWSLTFFLTLKKIPHPGNTRVVLDGVHSPSCASSVEQAIALAGRPLESSEIEEIVEEGLAHEGYISPRVKGVRFVSSPGAMETLTVYVEDAVRLKGVKVVCDDPKDTKIKKALQSEFEQSLGPAEVLHKAKYVQREYQLKTIAVEGLERDSLVLATRKKSTHTLEFPALSLEIFEGFNFFTEVRNRRIRELSDWCIYLNYAQNFPIKMAEELPRGMKLGAGTERGRSLPLVPDLYVQWKMLRLASAQIRDTIMNDDSLLVVIDTLKPDVASRFLTNYDTKYTEYRARALFPLYKGSYALIPGFEMAASDTYELGERPSDWQRELMFYLTLSHDNLDRMVFPESGWKADIDAKVDAEDNAWQRARAALLWVPLRWRIQNKVTTTFTMRAFTSWFSEKTPYNQRYAMGGVTPVGSYQLRLRDYEDLPGHTKEELVEPVMWKVGGSGRLAFVEREFLGLRVNAHLEGCVFLADANPERDLGYSADRLKICPSGGLYLDTSYGNIGLVVKGTRRNIWHHLYLGVVLYGLGL